SGPDCPPAVSTAWSAPTQIPLTSLPLALLATNIGPRPQDSYATIINSENQRQGAYSVGDQAPGATGKIKGIHFKYIDFEHNGRTERLGLLGATPPGAPAGAGARGPPTLPAR